MCEWLSTTAEKVKSQIGKNMEFIQNSSNLSPIDIEQYNEISLTNEKMLNAWNTIRKKP
jgi:hypothetical protein